MTPKSKRIFASVISLAAFAVIAVILYIYVPIDSSPSTLASTTTKSAVQTGDLQEMKPLSSLSNATSYVVGLAANGTSSFFNVSNTIRDSLPLPALIPDDRKPLVRNVIVIGSSITAVAIISFFAYKIHKVRALRHARMLRSHGILGIIPFISSAVFRQLSGALMVPQVSLTLGTIGILYFALWWNFGLSRLSSYLVISIMSGIGISASAYFISKQLGLYRPSAIVSLISDISNGVGDSLTARIAGNIATVPFLIIVPLLFFIGTTAYANSLIQYGETSSSLISIFGLLKAIVFSCIYSVLFVAAGTIALIINVNFISRNPAA
ncbi:hypothetical protein MDAP_000316 [Mitosporidium daphniae]|uniref:Uncharacterized protein n=1 Tax=Mitosporidium daphniae TaxID=1485682 RepID=A0A098VPY3_9MICR|nr:uncharacterized protein DI09_52p20 [Mitosporidium daphniae]XP_013238940.1 uncharacterized protein DI09_166p20 [Mitosporidium daphniae]KGG50849.1 hypothetical protein DI09_52p20 [Mitosporidium daphniae]KGG52504.1 hypothetical protein DI09_166p20 [Mitosporidium daphniae]|eukprot:XP_013237300.1 uncharacterized protein DI09_52p20 [Mitosporidium daphniae]